MTFSLKGSLSPEFFYAEGEPYDRSDWAVNKDGKPISVWTAIHLMSDEDWDNMCKDVFPDIDPEYVDPSSVMEKIEETDTCSNLDTPCRVWIDKEGWHTVEVYE